MSGPKVGDLRHDGRARLEAASIDRLRQRSAPARLRAPSRDARARLLDVLILLLASLPALLLALAISLAVRLESRGPILYRARRVGRDGELFEMFKFRKMRAGVAGPALTAAYDERFTRIGRFLARTKLDELPQLVNVARGEMRFVGPRPESERFVARFADDFEAVLQLPPGITGPSQLRYFREHVLLDGGGDDRYLKDVLPAKLAADRAYVATRSVPGDLSLLARTAWLIIRQLGAMARRVTRRTVLPQARALLRTCLAAAGRQQ